MKYCSKCGFQNKKENLFCKSCGEKFKISTTDTKKVEEKVEEKVENVQTDKIIEEKIKAEEKELKVEIAEKPKKKKSKFKIFFFIIFLLLLIGSTLGAYFYLSYMSSPEYVAKSYMQNLIDKDYDKIYASMKLSGDTTFTDNDLYMDLIKEELEENGEIIDYEIKEVDYSTNKEKATVKIKVTYKKSSGKRKETVEIKLKKGNEKKYVIFDSWTIIDQNPVEIDIINDYEIHVPTGSKVKFNDIKVEDKYIEESSEEYMITYKLPQVFAIDSTIEVELESGIKLKKEVTPSSYYDEYKLVISKTDLNDEDKEKIENSIKESLEYIMESLEKKNDFDDIKDNFSKKDILSDLEYTYEKYANKLENYTYNLSNFEVSNVTLSSIKFDQSYNLEVETKISYKWTGTSKDTNEVQNDDNNGYYTFYLNYEDGEYKIVDVSQLPNTYMYF